MHPILADWRRGAAYLFAWALVGSLLAALLVLAAPFGWVEAIAFAVPARRCSSASWVSAPSGCARPRRCSSRGSCAPSAPSSLAAVVSAALWLAAAAAGPRSSTGLDVFPGLVAKQAEAAPLLLGLGVALYLLAAALHYMIVAFGASREAERRALEFEIASREAELRALRAQIHPHFLFNSLNSINALIAARPEEARQLCVRLADFLRRSLTVGSRETIPLAEELDLAEQLLSASRRCASATGSPTRWWPTTRRGPAPCRRSSSSPSSRTRSPTAIAQMLDGRRDPHRGRAARARSCGSRSEPARRRRARAGRARASASRT